MKNNTSKKPKQNTMKHINILLSVGLILLLSNCGSNWDMLRQVEETEQSSQKEAGFTYRQQTPEGAELIFSYEAGKGLQAAYQTSTMPRPQAVSEYPVLHDAAGSFIRMSQLEQEEAYLLSTAGRWEVSEGGVLRYRGMRGEGWMQRLCSILSCSKTVRDREDEKELMEEEEEELVAEEEKAKEQIPFFPAGTASEYRGNKVLSRGEIEKILSSAWSEAERREETKNKIIPYFGRDNDKKKADEWEDNGCRFLSNFYNPTNKAGGKPDAPTITMSYKGREYPFYCLEVYYQCKKCIISPSDKVQERDIPGMIKEFQGCDAKESKKLANGNEQEQGYFQFDASKLSELDRIMFEGLLQKFPNDASNLLTKKLLATGEAILIEGNDWGDTSWGMVYTPGKDKFEGENKLGRMLMTIRAARRYDKERPYSYSQHNMGELLSPFLLVDSSMGGVGMPYKLMTPSSKEVEEIVQAQYELTGAEGYEISKVEKIRSRAMQKAYESKRELLDRRKDNWIFNPKWTKDYLEDGTKWYEKEISKKYEEQEAELDPDKLDKEIKELEEGKAANEARKSEVSSRAAVEGKLMEIVKASKLRFPPEGEKGVKELWLWHGTKEAAAAGIMTSGFASLASRDGGYYGKGLYFSSNVASLAVYKPEVYLLSKVCYYSAYPVARSLEIKDLYNKNNYENYDMHYVPTKRKLLPDEVYKKLKGKSEDSCKDIPKGRKDVEENRRNYPTDGKLEEATADEFVVFDPSQILLSYRVTLKPGDKKGRSCVEAIKEREAQKGEDHLWKDLTLEPLTKAKLEDPSTILSVDESIGVIYDCIQAGKQRAAEARGKDLVVFLGNTGSGKSTTINYLAGCEMEYVDMEEIGLEGEGEIARVREGSVKKPLMQIGHQNKSMTFMPTLVTDKTEVEQADGSKQEYELHYCDSPGFWDNRGPEINIANAVNIREVVRAARSIKIMLLLNYYSLKADRSRGLQDTYRILRDMFCADKVKLREEIEQYVRHKIGEHKAKQEGRKLEEVGDNTLRKIIRELGPPLDEIMNQKEEAGEKTEQSLSIASLSEYGQAAYAKALESILEKYQEKALAKHLPSMLIGITQVPVDGITAPKSREKLLNNFSDYPLLQAHKENIVTFDLWDEPVSGGIVRTELLKRLKKMNQINNPGQVFGSVLLPSDEQRLGEISEELGERIGAGIKSKGGEGIREALASAEKLDEIDHAYTRGIREKLENKLRTGLQEERQGLKLQSTGGNYGEAKKQLDNMGIMREKVEGVKGSEQIEGIYKEMEEHYRLSERYQREKEENERALRAKREEQRSIELALERKALPEQSGKEEQEKLAKEIRKLEKGQQLLEMKRILGQGYLGEEVWGKLGIEVKEGEIPTVGEELLQQVKALQTRGEEPILVLDLGKSIGELEEKFTSEGKTLLKADGDAEKLRAEPCYKETGGGIRWLLLPGSDHGVLPGSSRKTHEDQEKHMKENYPGYEVGGARELVTLYVLHHMETGLYLFPENPDTWARCKETYQTGEWGGRGWRVALGSSGLGGLVVIYAHDFYDYSNYGLLGFLSVSS